MQQTLSRVWILILLTMILLMAASGTLLYLHYTQIHDPEKPKIVFSDNEMKKFDDLWFDYAAWNFYYCVAITTETIDNQGRINCGALPGVVVKLNDNRYYILTAGHIQNSNETLRSATVCFQDYPDSKPEKAELLGYHRKLDAALLRFSNPNFVYRGLVAKLGNSSAIKQGDKVMIVTSYLDFVSWEVVLKRSLGGVARPGWYVGPKEHELWCTVVCEKGFSGGPVLNENGEIVAICTGGLENTKTGEPIFSFGTKVDYIKPILEDLRRGMKQD